MKKSFKGFTLVEVLIVIIIVGILIAALLPRLTGAQETARNTARTAGVNQLAQAVGLLMNSAGSLGQSGTVICVDDFTDLTGGSEDLSDYLASLPTDPQSAHDNSDSHNEGTACAGYYVVVVGAGGDEALTLAALEGTSNGNTDDFVTGSGYTIDTFQAIVDGDGDNFGVIIQG